MKNLIVFSAVGLGDRFSAAAPSIWTTMNGYAKAGWRVWIFNASITDGATGRVDYPDNLHLIQQEPPWRKQTQIKKIGHAFALSQYAWICRWHKKQAKALIAEEGLDKFNTVVYGMDVLSVPAARDIHIAYDMRLVTRFFGTPMTYTKPYDFLSKIRYYPSFQSLGTAADLVIMTNDGTKGDEVLDRVGNKSPRKFWRNGVDLPEDDPNKEVKLPFPPDARVLMTLCRLVSWKHVDRAVAALPIVLEKHPEVRLLICGYGSEQGTLERQAKELGVLDKIFFTGQIPHSDAFSYLKKADIFLSLYDLSNLGNPIFESMRCGKPIVTLDVGATSTVIQTEENGILLPMDNLESAIPAAIIRLLDDPALAKRLGGAALEYANKYFWTWDERIQAELDAVGALLPPDRE